MAVLKRRQRDLLVTAAWVVVIILVARMVANRVPAAAPLREVLP